MNESIKNGSCKVQYLYNSGFIIETEKNILIFDLCNESKIIIDYLLSNKQITFFVTHDHSDHYNPLIYQWASQDNVRYVVDKGVAAVNEAILAPYGKMLIVEPDKQYSQEAISIHTLGSTDRGVSFLVEVDGVTIFHSGDLNWWKWKNDSQAAQNQEEAQYKSEIQKLTGRNLDIAFVPVDPRLGEFYDLAVKHFAETIQVNTIVPMHFRESVEPIEALSRDWKKFNYTSIFTPLIKEGQFFYYSK